MPSETALQIIGGREGAAESLPRSGGIETTLCLECKDEIDIEEAIEGHCACCAHQIAYANAY
jgi:hypothetical protein